MRDIKKHIRISEEGSLEILYKAQNLQSKAQIIFKASIHI